MSREVRILHLTHTAQRGGAELALARLLSQPRWSASLCAPPDGDAFAGLTARGVTVQEVLPPLPGGGTRGRNPVLAGRYLAALHTCARMVRHSPLFRTADLLHANTAAAGIIGALAVRGAAHRRPLVVHVRDLVGRDSLGRFGSAAFTRLALRRADAVIANSGPVLESARAWLAPQVPAAVLTSPIGVPERITTIRTSPEVRHVGMLGRLQPWKGQHVFLQAFAAAFDGTRVVAHLAGAPLFGAENYARELRELAGRLGIADQVTFHGHVDDIAGFLDSLDVVVHASVRPEPLGQTVLQALARARPVIATEGGGPGEWIRPGVNGLLVPPDRPQPLAAALRKLAGSAPLRAALAEGAARTADIRADAEVTAAHADFFASVQDALRTGPRR